MNRTQKRRLGATIVIVAAIVGYTVVARDLDAQDAGQPGTPDENQSIVLSTPATDALQADTCTTQDRELSNASPATTPIEAALTASGLTLVPYEGGDTVISGIWELAPGASLEILDGTRALVRVSNGTIELTICGGDGTFDAVEGNGEFSSLAAGASQEFTSYTEVYLVLDESSGTFRITGASVDEDALVWIDVANATTDSIVCDGASCWGHPEATPNIATPAAGCGSVRCWSP